MKTLLDTIKAAPPLTDETSDVTYANSVLPATVADADHLFVQESLQLPLDLRQLWSLAGGLSIWEDRHYGQWGLVIHSPETAKARTEAFVRSYRGDQALPGDLVIGEFRGDGELVIARCDKDQEDFGHVVIAAEIEGRPAWPDVAGGIGEFLSRWLESPQEKFWLRKWR